MRQRSAPTMRNARASMIARNGRPTSSAPVSAVPTTETTTARKTPASSEVQHEVDDGAPAAQPGAREGPSSADDGGGGAVVMARP